MYIYVLILFSYKQKYIVLQLSSYKQKHSAKHKNNSPSS